MSNQPGNIYINNLVNNQNVIPYNSNYNYQNRINNLENNGGYYNLEVNQNSIGSNSNRNINSNYNKKDYINYIRNVVVYVPSEDQNKKEDNCCCQDIVFENRCCQDNKSNNNDKGCCDTASENFKNDFGKNCCFLCTIILFVILLPPVGIICFIVWWCNLSQKKS